ncbi:hypothetical protein QR680_003113 [Steinernema hermaphroditum]|uniref:Apple domain-containing protein n=1 Tax=Steinernema hermaphroditum TaxID=289476 RepID=A0AA39H5L2_9BILA|nr:hypothetical protein QR680_003113 [Steinernema hermaphroditum]
MKTSRLFDDNVDVSFGTVDACLINWTQADRCFEKQENTVLEVPEATTIVDINTVEECQLACLESYDEYNIVCKSIMFIRGVDECVLCQHSSRTRPEQLKEDLSYSIDYYENICLQSVEDLKYKAVKVATKVLDTIVNDKRNFDYQEEEKVRYYQLPDRPTTKKGALIRPGPVTRHHVPPQFISTSPVTLTTSTFATRVQRDFTEDTIQMASNTILITLPSQNGTTPTPPRVTTTVPDLPSVTIFGPGFECFHYKQNFMLGGYEEYRKPNLSVKRCLLLCSAKQKIHCASVNYNRETKDCVINGGSTLLTRDRLTSSPTIDYFENRCKYQIPTKHRSRSNDDEIIAKCFSQRTHQIIEDFNGIALEGVNSEKQCLFECGIARRNHKTACVAINWIQSIKGCIIFPKIARDLVIRDSPAVLIKNSCAENDVFGDSSNSSTNKDNTEDYYSS